ncbi:hypothetical protein A374_16003 [Fictibacillus macauensis ZFHKF-1]|uniref:TVP38/TMEM64 family membrane protein n=1 Tax=Fictibacillus macauensis ZFHKF-1 TaxID=1196324 RepID=I8UBJ0_9BACL|nr:VTT domain-containing protein [Fictibacillus macauensis]EIT84305.1 hypothetical protein A374_16003 [Fictibacillus macauensis ZFHKF-1]
MSEWQDSILVLMKDFGAWALVVSIVVNIIISVLGIIPSVFLTGANLVLFGFWFGTGLSFVGETLGALVSFWLYRKGLQAFLPARFQQYRLLQRLKHAQGTSLFMTLLSLRLLPFVPSGVVNVAAAFSQASALLFLCATMIGKVPAMLLEALSVQEVLHFSWVGKLLLAGISVYMLYYLLKKKKNRGLV